MGTCGTRLLALQVVFVTLSVADYLLTLQLFSWIGTEMEYNLLAVVAYKYFSWVGLLVLKKFSVALVLITTWTVNNSKPPYALAVMLAAVLGASWAVWRGIECHLVLRAVL